MTDEMTEGSDEESSGKVNDCHGTYPLKTENDDTAARIAALEDQVAILTAAVASMLPSHKHLDKPAKNG